MERMSNEDLHSLFSERFDILEQLMKMILINDILDEKLREQMENGRNEEIKKVMLNLEITDFRFISMCGRDIVILNLDEKVLLNKIKGVKKEIEEKFPDIEPVFCFPKINGKRRKIFEQRKISYGIEGKEICIF